MYSKHVSASLAAATHTALCVDYLIATKGAPSKALLAKIFQHAPPVSAPTLVPWRLTVSVPKLGIAVDTRQAGDLTQHMLQLAVQDAVVVLRDTLEV